VGRLERRSRWSTWRSSGWSWWGSLSARQRFEGVSTVSGTAPWSSGSKWRLSRTTEPNRCSTKRSTRWWPLRRGRRRRRRSRSTSGRGWPVVALHRTERGVASARAEPAAVAPLAGERRRRALSQTGPRAAGETAGLGRPPTHGRVELRSPWPRGHAGPGFQGPVGPYVRLTSDPLTRTFPRTKSSIHGLQFKSR
jgi:hypothetical protein